MNKLSFREQLLIQIAGGVAASSTMLSADNIATRSLLIVATIEDMLSKLEVSSQTKLEAPAEKTFLTEVVSNY